MNTSVTFHDEVALGLHLVSVFDEIHHLVFILSFAKLHNDHQPKLRHLQPIRKVLLNDLVDSSNPWGSAKRRRRQDPGAEPIDIQIYRVGYVES
jgi:hypothetical protein